MRRLAIFAAVALALSPMTHAADVLTPLAERYVRLMLAIGLHDTDFIDAYYGPPEWKQAVTARGKQPQAALLVEGDALVAALEATAVPATEIDRLRRTYLIAQTRAGVTRLKIL